MEFRVRSGSGSMGIFGKILLSLFLSIFLIAGLIALYAITVDSWRLVRSYTWDETACVIEASSHIEDEAGGDTPYRFDVRFRYEVDGIEYQSEVYKPSYSGSDSITDSQRLADRFARGDQTHCFVDPKDPSVASLRRDSLWRLFFLLVPFAFIVPGLGGLIAVWWTVGAGKKSAGNRPVQSISQKKVGSGSTAGVKGCGVLFFGVFLAAGLGFFIPFFALPMARSIQARGWDELPCTIEKSWVESHPGDDSTTYSIEVLYSYQIGDRTYKSDRYSFAVGSDSGYRKKQEIVDALPPGTRTTCFVDPDDPLSAVISRSAGSFLVALISLPFVVVGLGGVLFTLFGLRKDRTRLGRALEKASASPAPEPSTRPRELLGAAFDAQSLDQESVHLDEVILEPSAGPVAKFAGMLFIALFWNGIVSVFVWQVIKSFREGHPEGCMTVFLIPFVLVGLCLLVAVPYQFMAMFNPRPVLRLRPGNLHTGERSILAWSFRGAAGRISKLTLSLEGTESARYRQGTNTYTATETFLDRQLVVLERGVPMGTGEAQVEIPAGSMHSFDAGNNEILYKIKLVGEIRLWPDITYDFPVVVEPSQDFQPEGGEG